MIWKWNVDWCWKCIGMCMLCMFVGGEVHWPSRVFGTCFGPRSYVGCCVCSWGAKCTDLPWSLALALGHVHTSYVVYLMHCFFIHLRVEYLRFSFQLSKKLVFQIILEGGYENAVLMLFFDVLYVGVDFRFLMYEMCVSENGFRWNSSPKRKCSGYCKHEEKENNRWCGLWRSSWNYAPILHWWCNLVLSLQISSGTPSECMFCLI